MQTADARVRVRYAETDQMGIVHHANYLAWMEVGRVEWCRLAGIRYRDMERDDGILLTVVEASCRYIAPALFDDEVNIRTWLAEANPRVLSFEYEITEIASGRRLATGSTKHVFCGADRKPKKLPEKYRAVFGMRGSTE
jgi:acyl-CoA thioester hydrolase